MVNDYDLLFSVVSNIDDNVGKCVCLLRWILVFLVLLVIKCF